MRRAGMAHAGALSTARRGLGDRMSADLEMTVYIVLCSGPYIGLGPDAPWTRVEAVFATQELALRRAAEWQEIETDLGRGRTYSVEAEPVVRGA